MALPARIDTARLVLRRYRPEDAPLLKEAIDGSLERLQPWMPWARNEPTPLPQLVERLTAFAASFDAGTEWVIGIFDRDERTQLGGTGLHRRGPAHVLEIGYWVRTGAEGNGYITEAVDALRHAARAMPGVTHIRICCDPRNRRSAAVPERLGFTLLGVTANDDEAELDRTHTATYEWMIPAMSQRYRYHTTGLGSLIVIPWIALLLALAIAYMLFGNPNFLVPSTRPGGYFGLLLAGATSFYFFRFDRHRRLQFEATDAGLIVIGTSGKRELTAWGDLRKAEFRTNSGALVLTRAQGRPLILYPAALENGSALVTVIDTRTSLRLADIPDLQGALKR